MSRRRLFIIVFITFAIMVVLFLAGCAAGVNPNVDVADAAGKSAGFWSGLWNGLIAPITFIISLFTDNVNIYNVYNSGNWYDFGFVLGLSMSFGGGARGAGWRRKK